MTIKGVQGEYRDNVPRGGHLNACPGGLEGITEGITEACPGGMEQNTSVSRGLNKIEACPGRH